MELLRMLLGGILMMTFSACAKNFEPTLKSPAAVPYEALYDQPHLEGEFLLENGSTESLSNINNKPLLIFFVSETCASCRAETEELLHEFSATGLPTQINILSILIGSLPEDISIWRNSFSSPVNWTLGSDFKLNLYRTYFKEVKTPSVLYFDPATRVIKRWQDRQNLNTLKMETGPWF